MAKLQIIEKLERLEQLQKDHKGVTDLHDLILNGKPLHEIPGLVHKYEKTRMLVDGHDEYIKKKKWGEKLLITVSGVIGGAIITLLVKLIETHFIK